MKKIKEKDYLKAKNIVQEYEKQLNIFDISREDINKQAYIVMSNINATKITTNISDSYHEKLMNSFFTLQGMFNEYLRKNDID